PLLQMVNDTARDSFINRIIDSESGELKPEYADDAESIPKVARQFIDDEIDRLANAIGKLEQASFVGPDPVEYTPNESQLFERIANETLVTASAEQKARA